MPGAEESLSTTLASIQEGVERANEAWASWRATAVNASLAAMRLCECMSLNSEGQNITPSVVYDDITSWM